MISENFQSWEHRGSIRTHIEWVFLAFEEIEKAARVSDVAVVFHPGMLLSEVHRIALPVNFDCLFTVKSDFLTEQEGSVNEKKPLLVLF